MKKVTLLVIAFMAGISSFGQVQINEIDADQTSTDSAEFIELKTSAPNTSLDGYVVVLFNGSNDESYDAYDLDGFSTDANGFLLLGNGSVSNPDISISSLQNGEDAVAIYSGSDTDFPNGTTATSNNLIDALVYGTGDPDATSLLTALGETAQIDEDMNGNKDTESIQLDATDGSYCADTPTPDAANIDCGLTCPLSVFVDDVYCDAFTAGNDTYTVLLGFSGGGTEAYTITASAGTVGGDSPDVMGSGTISITGIPEGTDITYSVTSILCNISDNITSPDCLAATPVNDIAALRNGTVGDIYELTNEVLLTYQQSFRNQKYIEDASGAILIDDASGNITTLYNIGDGITGIRGELGEFNGILQFVPDTDPGAATSTGNTLTPQTVTLTQLTNNPADYDAELVFVQQATVTTADNTITTWVAGEIYDMGTADGAFDFRTSFYDADYLGDNLPSSLVDIVGIINRNDTDGDNVAEYFLTARSAVDITQLGLESNSISGLEIYPNPVSGNVVFVETKSNQPVFVELYNLLGKKVVSKNVMDGKINIGELETGIYLMKLTQDGKTHTKKLIVE
jgi:hypothetical protein